MCMCVCPLYDGNVIIVIMEAHGFPPQYIVVFTNSCFPVHVVIMMMRNFGE